MSNKISIGFYNIVRHILQKSAKPFLTLRIHNFLSVIILPYSIRLVMKQTDSCKCHNHIVLVCTLDDKIITYRTTRLCDILHTTLLCTLYIIREWEECIRTKCYISISIEPSTLLLTCKYWWLYLETLLPFALAKYILILITDVNIDCIVTICTSK